MGVQIKLADKREVNGKKYEAGDVVDVDSGEARRLVAVGAGVRVDKKSVPAPNAGAVVAPAVTKPGETGRKG